MMFSTKALLLLIFALALSAVQSTELEGSPEVSFRDLMDNGNHTMVDMDEEEGCHCMGDGSLQCEDADKKAMCHCMGTMLHCGEMMDHSDMDHSHADSHDSHDDMAAEMKDDSAAPSMRLMGPAIAGVILAAAL